MYPEGSMSDKPDSFHLGGCIMSPIWLQQPAEAEAMVLSEHNPATPVPLQPAQPSPSPERRSWLLSVARLPLSSQLLPSFPQSPLLLSPTRGFSPRRRAVLPSRPPGDSPVRPLSLPAPPRSCPDLETDTPIVRSCFVSHMLESRGTRQLPALLLAAFHLKRW